MGEVWRISLNTISSTRTRVRGVVLGSLFFSIYISAQIDVRARHKPLLHGNKSSTATNFWRWLCFKRESLGAYRVLAICQGKSPTSNSANFPTLVVSSHPQPKRCDPCDSTHVQLRRLIVGNPLMPTSSHLDFPAPMQSTSATRIEASSAYSSMSLSHAGFMLLKRGRKRGRSNQISNIISWCINP